MPRGQLGSNKTSKQKAQKTESELAKRYGGRATPNSGALAHRKGDVDLTKILLEAKETEHRSFRLMESDLKKITKEAREVGKSPAFSVRFHKMQFGTPATWVMVPLGVFDAIVEAIQRGDTGEEKASSGAD